MQVSPTISACAVGAIAGIHFIISAAEMLFPQQLLHHLFNFSQEEARKTGPIVANAGLYNGFLAAGLLWSARESGVNPSPRYFFLACVIVAGIFGAITLKSPKALAVQTIPALIAISLVWRG